MSSLRDPLLPHLASPESATPTTPADPRTPSRHNTIHSIVAARAQDTTPAFVTFSPLLPHSTSLNGLNAVGLASISHLKAKSVPNSPTAALRHAAHTHTLPLEKRGPDLHHDLGEATHMRWEAPQTAIDWVTCFCRVGFDLEVGPDSKTGVKEEICFSFSFNDPFPQSRAKEKQPREHPYFAYVFFRQRPDASIKRGFYQKSIVLISRIAAHDLFLFAMRSLGPYILDEGETVLETVLEQTRHWPPPQAGTQEFPLLGSIITCHFLRPWQDAFSSQLLTTPQNLPALLPTFVDMVPKLWSLWEIMLIGDPVAIIGHCPSICTEAVLGLMSLILPLSVAIDYRTYITIQDPNSKRLFSTQSPPNTLVAISNPFFLTSLRHWPHVLQLTPPCKLPYVAPTMKVEFTHGLTTKHRRVVSRDKTVLASVARGLCSEPPIRVSTRLQTHFHELTERFLAPVRQYLDTLWPTSLTLLSTYPIDPLPFNRDQCLAYVRDRPVAIPVKSILADWVPLYQKFLQTAALARWVEYTLTTQKRVWERRYLATLCATDLRRWAIAHDERAVRLVLARIVAIKDAPEMRMALSETEFKQLRAQEALLHSLLHSPSAKST